MEQRNIGFALCGSFCTLGKAVEALAQLAGRYTSVWPIMSEITACTDTRFGQAEDFKKRVEEICGRSIITTVAEAEPIGPKKLLDALVIAPCTGNTLAKLAHGIADGPVTMAAKSHLRNGRPVIVAVSSNDALSTAAENIGKLLARKHYYFVPFRQDDPVNKPTSMVADFTRIPETIAAALESRQLQPILL